MTFTFTYNVPVDNQQMVSNPGLTFTIEAYYLWDEPNGKPFININIPGLTISDAILVKDWLLAYNQIADLAEQRYLSIIDNNVNSITCSI